MTTGQRFRQVCNAANLSTLLGVAIAILARVPLVPGPRGLLIAGGYSWRLPRAGAFTLGNVVLFRAPPELAGTDPVLLAHEERHCTQYAVCLGLPFLPLYFACAAWSILRAGDPASRNFFERHAGLVAGGYADMAGSRPQAGVHKHSQRNRSYRSEGPWPVLSQSPAPAPPWQCLTC